MVTIKYTAWDGSQRVRLSAEKVFEKLAEYLSYTDDVQQAFDWLMRHGFDLEGTRIMGIDDLLEAVREEMRKRYQQYNLEHALDDVRRRLDELLELEREAVESDASPQARDRREQLERLPRSIAETLERLRSYEFSDDDARQEFENLLDELDNIRDLESFRRQYGEIFQGPDSLDYEQALSLMREMRQLNELEESLVAGNLQAIGAPGVHELLGERAAHDLEQLRQAMMLMQSAGYLFTREGQLQLSPKGVRQIGQLALRQIYEGLLRDRAGTHGTDHRGVCEVRPEATKLYEHGDPLNIDLVRTLRKALVRRPSTPLQLDPSDFEVFDTHHATTTSTVLLLDMSWSMSWEGRFAAAKKVAMAMESLIRARYPRDYFGIVGFYTRATELKLRDLPEASWNMGDPFTNLQDGLRLAGDLLRRHPSTNRYMIIITDGQPTAYFSRGRLYCEWPLSFGGISVRAAQETLREVERITRQGIVINTFMLDDSPSLRAFVERMTRINRGRALFTRPDRLGKYLLVDYIARKRKRV